LGKKTCIITGGNRGIGKGIAEGIAKNGHKAVIVSRKIDYGQKVVDTLKSKYGDSLAEVIQGDLSSLKNVEKLSKSILDNYSRVDCLVHNAAIWPSKLNLNEEGFEMAYMVNHLASFYLNHMLLTRLRVSKPSRIILVNAALYSRGNFDHKLTPTGGDFSKIKTYMNTKLCGILYMQKVAPILGDGVTINAVHPGVIRTGLGDLTGITGLFVKFFKLFQRSTTRGARGPINLALNPEISTNDKYYNELKLQELVGKALDFKTADILWEINKKQCGIEKYGDY
jgi:NAD(P)-dependent dehydrogenase (short-subunit alcohol dehydrogenase family)